MKKIAVYGILAVVIAMFAGCGSRSGNAPGKNDFVILSGSENETLAPLLKEFGQANKMNIVMQYKGSVDIMQELSSANIAYDAVWPANSLWLALGDKNRVVKYEKSIMTSPVVFGIRKSLAEQLGFVGKDVTVSDLLAAIRNKQLTFMMTSATQSNSGASAYLGFLYALLGNPDVLTADMLDVPQLRADIKELLGGLNRSSGSSGWLKDLFLQGNYDAMVNYEAVIIETNQELVKQHKEPLYVVYPVDGIVLSDSPLGYIDRGDQKKEARFKKLQDFLLSEAAQNRILKTGRRTGFGGMMGATDPSVFNPEWGVQAERILSPLTIPAANVIEAALNMYQTEFRKPSLTVYCLDFSGSMKGEGDKQLKQAMTLLLNQEQAKTNLLNASNDDVTIILPFNNDIIATWEAQGNDPQILNGLLQNVLNQQPGGGTNIYLPAALGLEKMLKMPLDKYVPAIILMTDGKSDGQYRDFADIWQQAGVDIPVFSIMFGDAESGQLDALANLTRGRVFDGRQDLVKAFRTAKGYN